MKCESCEKLKNENKRFRKLITMIKGAFELRSRFVKENCIIEPNEINMACLTGIRRKIREFEKQEI